MAPSEATERTVRAKASKLDQFADHIMGCRIVIDLPHGHHAHGNLYQVRIAITVPGEEIVVNRERSERVEHRDIEVAIRDAFDAAYRQLEDYVRRRRGSIKQLATAPHGRVSRMFPEAGYGFIETSDGREIYFHRHSVLHEGFDDLQEGAEVSFVEEAGKKGLQASTVKIVGRHGHA